MNLLFDDAGAVPNLDSPDGSYTDAEIESTIIDIEPVGDWTITEIETE